jgi:hypothetical protein
MGATACQSRSHKLTDLSVCWFFVAPLQTTYVGLTLDSSELLQQARSAPLSSGLWSDVAGSRQYPEAFSLQGLLLSREPASVTEPLDLTGLADNRLSIESQRSYSWTDTQYKLQGMNVSDSYQPGLPAILPDLASLDEVVVGGVFPLASSSSNGTEVDAFLAAPPLSFAEPHPWHAALSTTNTGAALSSSNLPPPPDGGLVVCWACSAV